MKEELKNIFKFQVMVIEDLADTLLKWVLVD